MNEATEVKLSAKEGHSLKTVEQSVVVGSEILRSAAYPLIHVHSIPFPLVPPLITPIFHASGFARRGPLVAGWRPAKPISFSVTGFFELYRVRELPQPRVVSLRLLITRQLINTPLLPFLSLLSTVSSCLRLPQVVVFYLAGRSHAKPLEALTPLRHPFPRRRVISLRN